MCRRPQTYIAKRFVFFFWRNAEVACVLYIFFLSFFFYVFGFQSHSGVFSHRIARRWTAARFHARLFPIIFMNADKSHIFRAGFCEEHRNDAKRHRHAFTAVIPSCCNPVRRNVNKSHVRLLCCPANGITEGN